MQKRILPLLMALLLVLLPLSACKGTDDNVKAKGAYYEKMGLALQNTFAETNGTTLEDYKDVNLMTLDLTLEELTGLEQLGMELPVSLPLSFGVKSQSDSANKKSYLGINAVVNGSPLKADVYTSESELVVSAPDLLSKNILVNMDDLLALTGMESLPGFGDTTEAAEIATKLAALPAVYGDVIKNAVPEEAKTTEKMDFETVDGTQNLKAQVVSLTGPQVAEIFRAVKNHAAQDAQLKEVYNYYANLFSTAGMDDSIAFEDVMEALEAAAADAEEESGIALTWARPILNGSICGDIITAYEEGQAVVTITMGYTENKENAKGFVYFEGDADGEKVQLKLDYTMAGATRKLVLDVDGEATIELDSVVSKEEQGVQTKTDITVTSAGISIQPLTVTTVVKTAKSGAYSADMFFDITIPEALTGVAPITAKISASVTAEKATEEISFPTDYASNVYDMTNEEDLYILEEELMYAILNILMAGQF